MCSLQAASQSKAYFSIDALFAMSISIFAFFAFSGMLSAFASYAHQSADENARSLLALRISDYIVAEAGERQSSFYFSNRLSRESLGSINPEKIRSSLGIGYLSVSLADGKEPALIFSSGEIHKEAHCARRLVEYEGSVSVLEVCAS
ncbi:MAG: hypothetical protein N3F07_01135 [Candidatus Micrarchaeota archaeon]|nr:hypothetical protein [Candidatus Micrarchaeota archaeon]